jgi:Short C-terminal domain
MTEQPTPANGDDSAAIADGAPPAPKPKHSIRMRRLVAVDVLLVLTTILGVVAMFAIYANRLLFSPANWASTSTRILANDAVRTATANYIVDQVYANTDVTALIKSGLPTKAQPLAGPAAGALRSAAVQATEVALQRPRVQDLWQNANYAADQQFINVVSGGKGAVGTQGGEVTLDLGTMVTNVAARLGLSVPSGVQSKLGKVVIFKSHQLKAVQDISDGVRHLAWWLTALVPLLYGLTIYLAKGHRRRTLMSVGFAILLSGVLVLWGRDVLITQVNNALVKDQSLRPAGSAVMSISTDILSEIASAFVLIGAVVVACAWFAGPAKLATAGRRAIAPFMRDHVGWTFGITTAVMVIVFIIDPIPATGKPVGMLVFLGLALFGTEVLRRQIAEEHPDAEAGATMAAFRGRLTSLGGSRQGREPATTAGTTSADASLPAQLERLDALRRSGAITPDEYDAAKANLLHT